MSAASRELMFPKTDRVRLKGKPLAALNAETHQRDQGCVMCGGWVDPGEKMHHVIFKSHGGGDTADNCVILCRCCHGLAHGPSAKGIRDRLLIYLEGLK